MITNDYPHVSQWRAQATEQGREQGIEQGREQGIEQGREQGIEQGIEQGSVKTRVADILRILARRNVSVPENERTVIEACTDMGTLETWFDRALVVGDISDLFAR
jgi:flagellar biosynthesis/type III secretory pathway protein FliH